MIKIDGLMPAERIESKIFLIRGQSVMLDRDLAELYEVKTFVLNQAVKRNLERFPADFMFKLTKDELVSLRSQFVILKNGSGSKRGLHRKYLPYAFTENGVAMLSSALKSKRAVQVNIQIMRVFTRWRQILSNHKKLAEKINCLEEKHGLHLKKHDEEIGLVFEAIRKLLLPPEKPKRKIGFLADRDSN